MSFALTTEQFKARTKNVTRRRGWGFLRPGQLVCAVEKGMGLKKGEAIKRLGVIRILSTRWEKLNEITQEECVKEGFPLMLPLEFVNMFCDHMGVKPDSEVNRIEFEYVL